MNENSVIDGKRVWIYQRDSLGNNSAKLEEQKQKMLELAEHHGFEVVGCTTEIASGKKIRRKGIHKIKRVFKKKRADILMVKSLDRLTVNMSCYEELDGWFRMQNVKVFGYDYDDFVETDEHTCLMLTRRKWSFRKFVKSIILKVKGMW